MAQPTTTHSVAVMPEGGFVNNAPLDLTQFQKALTVANRHFTRLRKKYPHLRAYLVLSVLGEQTKIDSSLEQMIGEFPDVLAVGTSKIRMLDFLKTPQPEKPTQAQKQQRHDQFEKLAEALEFEGKTQIEIRFHHLDYDLIWKLQSDDLVDRKLTPQTKASINIVLGTLSDFESCGLEP